MFVKSTAKIKEELRKNKKFFQKYFDTPDELDAKAASISDTLGCDIAMRTGIQPVTARILIARLAVTRRYNNAYVLFDRLASIPAKLKCLKIGILIAFGFLPNPNSSVPSVFQGNEMSLKFSDEDLDAMKFLNSDAVKDVQLFETLLEQLD